MRTQTGWYFLISVPRHWYVVFTFHINIAYVSTFWIGIMISSSLPRAFCENSRNELYCIKVILQLSTYPSVTFKYAFMIKEFNGRRKVMLAFDKELILFEDFLARDSASVCGLEVLKNLRSIVCVKEWST